MLERLSKEFNLNVGRRRDDKSVDATNNDAYSDELQQLPNIIREEFLKYTATDNDRVSNLLPIQQKSYEHIASGGDTVLFSPTGTGKTFCSEYRKNKLICQKANVKHFDLGKTLAYVLPLAARLLGWKRDGSLASKRTHRHRSLGNKNSSMSPENVEPASPSILVIEPSRELAKQVGKVWTRFHPTANKNSKKHVVTVFGGVPMLRHAAQLSSKTDVVVGTPGRIKELIREKFLSTDNLKSIVLDEADTLLNFKDVPEVEWLLDGMQNDYQLVLASATINKRVHLFVDKVMEISVGEEGYIVSDGVHESRDDSNTDVNLFGSADATNSRDKFVSQPEVRHWSMAASTASRVALASDLILTIGPRRGIIFAPSKAEVEQIAQELSERLSADHSIHVLHGDMIQQARSRAIATFKGESTSGSQTSVTRILVATGQCYVLYR